MFKKYLLILFLFSGFSTLAQVDTNIIKSEVPEVIIQDKKMHLLQFNLDKYRSIYKDRLKCEENIGVYIPQNVQQYFYLKSVEFPIEKFTDTSTSDPIFFVLIQYPTKDSIVILKSKMLTKTSRKIKVDFEESIYLAQSINGFFFFMKPSCSSDKFASDFYLEMTYKIKSQFTYEYNEKRVGFKKRRWEKTIGKKSNPSNWKVKIDYAID